MKKMQVSLKLSLSISSFDRQTNSLTSSVHRIPMPALDDVVSFRCPRVGIVNLHNQHLGHPRRTQMRPAARSVQRASRLARCR